jgi:hypothetical protein
MATHGLWNDGRGASEPISIGVDKDDGTEVLQVDFKECAAPHRYFRIAEGGRGSPKTS